MSLERYGLHSENYVVNDTPIRVVANHISDEITVMWRGGKEVIPMMDYVMFEGNMHEFITKRISDKL